MNDVLSERLEHVIAQTAFSGVVQVARGEHVLYSRATGFADRAHRVPNTLDTLFAIASGTKAFTALAVMSLVAEGALALDAAVHTVLEAARELVEPAVTIRHLLAHTSGMGDYLNESAISDIEDYALDVPGHRLARPADFVPILRGRSPKFSPGTSFAYCNSGYVLLALVLEAASGRSYYDVVAERVCAPAGLLATTFLRLDELPASAAIGYLPKRGWRTNHLHLPVRGAGDGGIYTTAEDVARFWTALHAGRIVPPHVLTEMVRPQHAAKPASHGYGLGFWIAQGRDRIFIEGSDPGISFRSSFEPATGLLYTVLSNTTSGAWPIVKELEPLLPQLA